MKVLDVMIIPATVPQDKQKEFIANYKRIVNEHNKLLLFAVDHKIEHMHDDFVGPDFVEEIQTTEHIFAIANNLPCGALATHLGLIARHAQAYKNISYIVKMNAKTHAVPKSAKDPFSKSLWTIDDVMQLKRQGINIAGIGYVLYVGSEFEASMLQEAAQLIMQAHAQGLVTIIWAYARGKHISNEHAGQIIAGAAGVAHSIGADFIKLQNPMHADGSIDFASLPMIQAAAGNSGIIFAGGALENPEILQQRISSYMKAGIAGVAVGRNLFQLPTKTAQERSKELATLLV